MTENQSPLGKLEAVYGTSPAVLQRAAIVAALSFVFFLALMLLFSLTQKFVFFLLSTAFLIVELLTMFGWLAQKSGALKVFENGFAFKKKKYLWSELESIRVSRDDGRQITGEIETRAGKKILLTGAIAGVENFFKTAETKISARK